jgi:hypothetical protein
MPEFESYIDIDVDDFLSALSSREKEELVDAMVEDGWVKRIHPKGTNPENNLPSVTELDWQELTNKFSLIRLRISSEDEETIRQILKKY